MRHIPEEPVGRDLEIEKIVNALKPVTRRKKPENLLIYGPAGVGKSLCVSHVLERLNEERRVRTVRINCWQYNTRPSFLVNLLIELGFPAPRKGKAVDELLSRLREWLDKNMNLVVALEEFDQMRDQTEVVYDLHHISQESEKDIGILLISNTPPSDISLDPRSESRLSCQTLEFRPYNPDQLLKILEDRADKAFHQNAITRDVLKRVAEIVAESSGDCREAFELLLRAGRLAQLQKSDQIDHEHIDAVI